MSWLQIALLTWSFLLTLTGSYLHSAASSLYLKSKADRKRCQEILRGAQDLRNQGVAIREEALRILAGTEHLNALGAKALRSSGSDLAHLISSSSDAELRYLVSVIGSALQRRAETAAPKTPEVVQ